MKILQVTQSFKPMWYYGGVVRSVYELSKHLVKAGHDVTVYTSNRAGLKKLSKNKKVTVDGIKVYYFENINNYIPIRIKAVLPPLFPFIVYKDIKNYDIVHIHEHRTFLSAIVHHYAKKHNIPVVLQPRGSIQRLQKTGMKKFYDTIIGYNVIKNAKLILLSSKKELELSKDIFNEIHLDHSLIKYIPNGIDISEYTELPSKNNFREKYGIKKSEKIILYLGRLHEVKGLDLLIDSFNLLISDNENIKLVIVGPDGGFRSRLESMISNYKIEDRILFIDGLFGIDKLAAYAAADVFVLPSKEIESFGNVALESIACGVPTLVTNVCGISEWTDELIVVEPDPLSIKSGIENVLQNNGIGFDKIRNKKLEKFYWNTLSEKILSFYKDIKAEK